MPFAIDDITLNLTDMLPTVSELPTMPVFFPQVATELPTVPVSFLGTDVCCLHFTVLFFYKN
jgi:hypothetical protein